MSNQASLGDISGSSDSGENSEGENNRSSEGRKKRRFGPLLMEIPESWRDERLKDVTELVTRGKQPTYADEGIPVINQECIYWSGWHWENLRYLDEEVGKDWKDKRFPNKGDVIINSTGQGTLGRALVYPDNEDRAIDSHVTLVRTDEDVQSNFFRYFLESKLGNGLLYSMCVNGSTGQIELSKSKLNLLSLPVPPIDEQRRIASVLYNVDQAIQKTEEIIEQTQRVKKGLMQDLFFSNSNADKEVQLNFTTAEVPQNWKKIQIGEIAKVKGRIGWRGYTKEDLRDDGPLVLGAGEINDRQKLELNETTHLSEEKYQESPEIMVEKGHIVLVQRGSLGKVALVDRDLGKCTINPSMILLKEIDIDQEFLYYLLCTEYIQGLIETHNSQTGVPMISQSAVENFNILKPPMAEQKEIAKKLRAVDDKIEKEIKEKEQLQRLKKGLMQDLLTGSVRIGEDVRVLDEVVEVEG